MKRKIFIVLLTLISVLCCAFGLSACGGGSGGVNGTYYAYENGKLDKSQYITLNGGKWSDDDDANGTYKINGTEIVFYAEVFGSNEEMYSGTLSDGVLKIKVMGANMTYCKEGSEPANGNGDGNTETPPETKNEYTVTYDANGGAFSDGKTTVTQKAKEGSTLTAPVSPSRTASAFSGWATDKGGKTLWKFASDTVTKNITLYAVWDEQSAAIISADGATIDESKMSVYMLVDRNTESVSLSNKIVCSTDSVWRLYYDRLGQTEIPTKIAAGLSGELKNGDNIFYIVVTSSNGAQVNVYELTVHRSYSVTVNYYDNKENLIKTDTAYTGYEYEVSYTPDISGYTFNYWKDKSGKKATSVIPENSVSFYADCTAKTYKATLNVNGGNALDKTEYTVTYDKGYGFAAPTRTGYTFAGWYSGETKLTGANGNSLENWTYAGARTLTAKWTANSYKLTLNKDVPEGGTVTGDGNHNYDATVTVSASTADGYTWLGWYDSEGILLTDKFNYSFKMGLAATYTAKWIACPVTLERNLSSAGTITYSAKTVADNEYTVTAKTNSGYTWLGWYNGEECLTTDLSYKYKMPSSSKNAVTYTAKWACYTLTTATNNDNAGTYTVKNNVKTVADTSVTLTASTNLGYVWLGWFNGQTRLTEELTFTFSMPSEIVTYTAMWQLEERMELFDFNSTKTSLTITSIKDKTVTEIIVPDIVTNISRGAFSGCSSVESITLPFVGSSVKTATDTYQYPFGYVFGTSRYTGGVPTIQNYYGSSTSSVTSANYYIPSSLKSVTVTGGNILLGAFYNCSWLTSVTIPDSVISIGDYAFYNCNGLTSVTIHDGVTSIGNSAFRGCSSLIIYCEAASKPSGWEGNWNYSGRPVVWDCNNNDKDENGYAYTVIAGIRYSLKDGVATVTSQPSNIVTANIPSTVNYKGVDYSVISIGEYAFYCCSGLTSITIPDSVTSIGEGAFTYCRGLTSVIIPKSVNIIGKNAFTECGFDKVYFSGTTEEWGKISIGSSNERLINATKYFYSEEKPTEEGNYWHYDMDGITPVIWTKEN